MIDLPFLSSSPGPSILPQGYPFSKANNLINHLDLRNSKQT